MLTRVDSMQFYRAKSRSSIKFYVRIQSRSWRRVQLIFFPFHPTEFVWIVCYNLQIISVLSQGSRRELGSAWTRSECTYQTVECFDTFTEEWKRWVQVKRDQRKLSKRLREPYPSFALRFKIILIWPGLPEPPIFEIFDSGSSSRQIPAPAPTPTPTPKPTPTHSHTKGPVKIKYLQ